MDLLRMVCGGVFAEHIYEYLAIWQLTLPNDALRYFLFAGIAFGLLYLWKRHPWRSRRIFADQRQSRRQFAAEFARSLRTILVFSLVGASIGFAKAQGGTAIYLEISEYGWPYLFLSFAIALVLHDAYFYWTHRLMHWRPLFKAFHLDHHRSVQPSPLAAYSFSFLETFVEAGIFPLLIFTLPMHPLAIFAWMMFMMLKNVLGHTAYEVYPRGFATNRWLNWNTTTSHHELHHRYFKGNYALYFSWWDRWMGTEHPEYLERFAQSTARPLFTGDAAPKLNGTATRQSRQPQQVPAS